MVLSLFKKQRFGALKKEIYGLKLENAKLRKEKSLDKTRIIDLDELDGKLDHEWYYDFLTILLSILKPKVYVELGLGYGTMFNRVSSKIPNAIGVDMDKDVLSVILEKDKVIIGSTDEALIELKNKNIEIDFLFIDADHSKEQSKKDFLNYFGLVSDHGIIIFHDTHPKSEQFFASNRCGDCYAMIMDLQKQYIDNVEMITIPLHPGLTICRKRKMQLKWQEVKI
jgi:predicted O-methyltransferase YrrM